MCAALELPEPRRREFVSVRLARHRPHHGDAPAVELVGESWVVATPTDPVEPVPAI
ncbi:NaeI family type II restriction endonuclease [Saccharopolyspora sp. NPDC000995]